MKKYIILSICLIILTITIVALVGQSSNFTVTDYNSKLCVSSDNDSLLLATNTSHLFAGAILRKNKPEPGNPDDSEVS